MELRHLRVALALADELHFGRTAARLRVAQSAVSQTLKALEEELGATLFERGRTVRITPAGERFLARAREAMAGIDRGAAEARQAATGTSGRLSLRFTLTSALTIVPRVVVRFQREFPGIEVQLEPGGSAEQLEAIHAGRCDIGFMSRRRDIAPLATELIEEDALVALLPRGHALARKSTVRLNDLARERMLFVRESGEPEVRAKFRRRCAEAGFDLAVAMEFDQLEVLLAMVAAGAGVSCLPGLVRRMPFPGVRAVPLSPHVRTGISAVWDPRSLSAVGRRFLKVLREERDARAVNRE